MIQLYFIRHAESENNALYTSTSDWAGRTPDPGITAKGQKQARLLADFLARDCANPVDTARHDPRNANGFGLTHLYCSPMRRALLTGQAITEAVGLPLVVWEELHERGGIFELDPGSDARTGLPGATAAELQGSFPQARFPEDWGVDGWWNRPAESSEQHSARAARLLDRLMQEHGQVVRSQSSGDEGQEEDDGTTGGSEVRVALISHGGFYQDFLRTLLARAHGRDNIEMVQPFWFALNNTAITRIDFRDWGTALVYSNRIDHLPAELVTS